MGRRSEFAGIAQGLAQHLCSRNNDYFGQWTVGALCSVAQQEHRQFDLDLRVPGATPLEEAVRAGAAARLQKMSSAARLDPLELAAAKVQFVFSPIPYTRRVRIDLIRSRNQYWDTKRRTMRLPPRSATSDRALFTVAVGSTLRLSGGVTFTAWAHSWCWPVAPIAASKVNPPAVARLNPRG